MVIVAAFGAGFFVGSLLAYVVNGRRISRLVRMQERRQEDESLHRTAVAWLRSL